MAALQMGVLCSDGGSYVQFVPGLSLNCGFGYKKVKMKLNMGGCSDRVCCRPMSVSMRHVDSKANVEAEAEFKPSFGQYLKVMETVKIKRKERKDKSYGDKDCELGEGSMNKSGEKLKADEVMEKKTGLRPIVEGSSSVEKFGRRAVNEGPKDAGGYGQVHSNRELDVRNAGGRATPNVKWIRNHEGTVRENSIDLDKWEGKPSVWQNQRSPRARESDMEIGKDEQPVANISPYDRREGFSPRAHISDVQKGNIRKLETKSRYEKDNGRGFMNDKMSRYDRQEGLSHRAHISDVRKGKSQRLETPSRYEKDYDGGFRSESRRSEMDSRKFNRANNSAREIIDDESFGMDRAAFKNLEVLDEGRVSRMLMEERLQRLAKTYRYA